MLKKVNHDDCCSVSTVMPTHKRAYVRLTFNVGINNLCKFIRIYDATRYQKCKFLLSLQS